MSSGAWSFFIGAFVVIATMDLLDRSKWQHRMTQAAILGVVLAMVGVVHYNVGYSDGANGVESKTALVPERPVLYEAASESILAAPLDTDLQEELKDVTGQPEPSEPVQDVRAAQSTPPSNAQVWDAIASCESNNNWHIATGNGYRGGLQWNQNTWMAVKPDSAPNDPAAASREQEIAAANNLMAEPWGGYQHWPVCSKVVGLR